jgi:hypothetical protein
MICGIVKFVGGDDDARVYQFLPQNYRDLPNTQNLF